MSIWSKKNILFDLIKNDFRSRYLGNHLGIIWAFIQPLVMVLVYWFVFVHGFRNTPVDNVPFLMWLLCGMVPWFLLNDALTSASNSIMFQSYLVKKIVFDVKLLPLVKIGSAIIVSFVFFILLMIVCICYGHYPELIWIQLIYYFICLVVLTLGMGLFLSAITPFIPDTSQIFIIFMQIMFWATPVFWNKDLLKGKMALIYILNPFAYIVNGYRDTLVYKTSVFDNYAQGIYFWIITLLIIYIGNKIFNKLRPHFADVL